ncbi:uncharacterized protein LOC130407862 [Triplophysa dalaica]|uniref:uncharacterized protein LOC130407862 n=1 Tax=Triplophysa dalaica TaxID=1582913 RepID=UPI0024E00942|nr:uncharacterized protein LOC130407862 [Triplophysa dalaica]
MPTELATQSTALQIPAQTVDRNLIVLGMSDVSVRKPSSSNQSALGCWTSTLPRVCWDLELSVAVLFMVLAGLLILALLYRVLTLRHRLRVAQAGNALEYFGFYHMAQYDLKELVPQPALPVVTPQVSHLLHPHLYLFLNHHSISLPHLHHRGCICHIPSSIPPHPALTRHVGQARTQRCTQGSDICVCRDHPV